MLIDSEISLSKDFTKKKAGCLKLLKKNLKLEKSLMMLLLEMATVIKSRGVLVVGIIF